MFVTTIRRYLISGLLVWVPIIITIVVIKFIVDLLGSSLLLLPKQYQPDAILGFHIPGIGVILTLLVIFLTGLFVANLIGMRLIHFWEKLLIRIPLVRPIYTGVKQVTETILKPSGQSFRKVVLVEYPREGLWTVAFQTGQASAEMEESLGETDVISLFIPTTPNPTSGFLLMTPRNKVKELDIGVDQALKFVISLGVVQPIINVNKTEVTTAEI